MRTFVTGVGCVSSAGGGAEALASALAAGRSCLRASPGLEGRLVGRIPDEGRAPSGDRLDPVGRLFVQAADEAWRGAGLEVTPPARPDRVALLEGTSLGPAAALIDVARGRVRAGRPSNLLRFMPGSGGAAFAIAKNIRGSVLLISAGSASAAFALGQAHLEIQGGRADLVVVGGAEAPLHPDIVAPFVSARILAPPGEPARPLDEKRRGPNLGEGSGVLILESESHARARGAEVLATLDGFGWANEARSPLGPDPDGRGVGRAVHGALTSVRPARPGSFLDGRGWVALHGTGTPVNDRAECEGLQRLLRGDFARTPVTALKSTVGHCLGAGAALEAVGAVLAMKNAFIPGVPTLRQVDPSLPSCDAVTGVRDEPSGAVLLLAESFGGRCAALAFGRDPGRSCLRGPSR